MAKNSSPPGLGPDELGVDANATRTLRAKLTTPNKREHPQKLALRPCPRRPTHWLAKIDDLAEFPIRRAKLARWKRVRNVARYQLNIELPAVPPPRWNEIVAAAMRGGA
jgi:hypothetical protein